MPFVGKEIIIRMLRRLNLLVGAAQNQVKAEEMGLIEDARREWQTAREYFNSVTDPDLIDYAIHTLGAAEKRYVYLLRRAREEKLFQEDNIS